MVFELELSQGKKNLYFVLRAVLGLEGTEIFHKIQIHMGIAPHIFNIPYHTSMLQLKLL